MARLIGIECLGDVVNVIKKVECDISVEMHLCPPSAKCSQKGKVTRPLNSLHIPYNFAYYIF